jgi:NAD(P)-dependent dehydrogenase (short-subunit alcohol dehydrogenase family)
VGVRPELMGCTVADIRVVQPSPLGTGGRIIFVSATIHYRGMPFQTHVSVAKAGIDALSHSVAIEYGPRGVTSNIIAPGPIAQTEVSTVSRRIPPQRHTHTDHSTRAWSGSFHRMLWRPIPRPSLSVASATFATSPTPLCICSRIQAAMSLAKPLLVSP